ncbi:PBSX family phage terminase large subunit [Paenibacillus sp. sgz302251]|uniref:PBSX family phage terminase large subunit n=1 Tax=Paenibacillus sp. sgz302251 TaxID=3414493 RepID=UPI003C7A8BAE
MKINLSNLPKITNPVYYPLYRNNKNYLVLYGGGGSGKSVFAVQKLVFRMLTESPHRFLVVRKVKDTLRTSVFQLFLDVISQWGLSDLFKINTTSMEITFKPNGNKTIFKGLDDPEKIKSIAGITGIWVEEATELSADDLDQLDIRLRGNTKHYKQIIISFNPIVETHWLKKRFFDYDDPDAKVVKTTYKDNVFIDAEYIRKLEKYKEINLRYYKVYALGEWGTLGDVIFENYAVQEISTLSTDYNMIIYGLDFGYHDPSVLVRVGIKGDDIYILEEFYRTKLTNTDLIEEAKKRVTREYQIIADSAEADRIQEFKRAGFRIKGVKKGKGSVKDGIDFMRARRIYIHPSCVEAIKEFGFYEYKKDKQGNSIDEPMDAFNHVIDAIRYAISDWRLKTGKGIRVLKPKGR